MGEVLKKFGRYFLLDHVAQGGMAEIYRARLASVDGAGRLMVIKRIQAGFGANVEFLQMFKSEIKVTMGFNHPNIVQLYDFGEEQNQPYIAMELVDGKNLRQFMTRFNELKQTFPIELATFIAEQSASGLHYAHAFKDKISGVPLNIVHRDISPQNILISFEGNVKVIDFGIAKATTNIESTRAGVIKGKPSYLSPEQISGEVLDGRSDIFALGAVLWESLTGKKLFAGENDLAVLKLIESCQTYVKPPSTLNPKVPKELDYIVLKTLSKQREKRYQTAEELQRALHKFLYAFMPEFNPSDLAYYAKDLFKNEIVEDRKRIQKLNDKVEAILALEVLPNPAAQSGSSESSKEDSEESDSTITSVDKRASSSGGREAFTLQNVKADTKIEIEAIPKFVPKTNEQYRSPIPQSRQTGTLRSPTPDRTASSSATPRPSPPKQRKVVSQDDSGGYGKIAAIAVVAILTLSIFGPEFGIQVPILSGIVGDWIGGSEARLVLEGNEKNAIVAINGNSVANALPATLSGLTVGTPFRVSVTTSHGSFQQELTLRKGEKKVLPVTLSTDRSIAAAIPTGLGDKGAAGEKSILLRLRITPGGGNPTILLSGRTMNSRDPSLQVPLDAPLELTIQRTGYMPFKREFVLDSRQVANLKEWPMDVALAPERYGFLTIHSTPSADITIPFEGGTSWVRQTPLESEKIPIGQYSIKLRNDVLGMEKTVNIRIEDNKLENVDVKLEIGK